MKSLFLLGIFAALTVIAVKKPDQTAWEFIQEAVSIAKTASKDVVADQTEIEPEETPTSRDASDGWKTVEHTVATLESRTKDLERAASKIARSDDNGGKAKERNDMTTPETASPMKKEPAPLTPPRSTGVKEMTLPEIPVLSEKPVTASNVDEFPVLPGTKPIAESPQDYGDVKALYENASRLLDQIK